MVRSAAKNYEHVAVVTDPADYEPVLKEMAAAAGALGAETRFRLAQKAFSHTAAYDGAISNYLTALDGSGGARRAFRSGSTCSSSACRRCATARTRTRRPRSTAICEPAPGSLGALSPAAGQGAFLQQHRRRRCGVGMREELRRAGVRHRQARQPLRRGGRRRHRAEAYRKAFATDPTSAFGGIIAFNRELDGGRGASASTQQFVEVVIAPGDHARRRRGCWRARPTSACSRCRSRRAPTTTTSSAWAAACWCRRPTPPASSAAGLKVVTRAQADRGADGRPAVRLARRQVREVQRHRVLRRRPDARRGRGPDEPRRLGAHRRHQGGERRPDAAGVGGRVRRLLPVPRRRGRGGAGGRARRSSSPAAACATTK